MNHLLLFEEYYHNKLPLKQIELFQNINFQLLRRLILFENYFLYLIEVIFFFKFINDYFIFFWFLNFTYLII